MKIMVIGDFGSGKSTTISYLINKLPAINKMPAARMSELIQLDTRERLKNKSSATFHFIEIDAPGSLQEHLIIENLGDIVDCFVLIVDSTSGEFEIGMMAGGNTRELAMLAHNHGSPPLICCVNKMDATTPKYSKERYDHIKQVISSFLTNEVGYKPDEIWFIPISGREGDNLTERSTNLNWHEGPTLAKALKEIMLNDDNPLNAGFRRQENSTNSFKGKAFKFDKDASLPDVAYGRDTFYGIGGMNGHTRIEIHSSRIEMHFNMGQFSSPDPGRTSWLSSFLKKLKEALMKVFRQ